MNAGLTAAELDDLRTRLVGRMELDRGMPLDMAHGFLTATAAGPRAVPEAEWLDGCLFGDTRDTALNALLRRFRNDVIADLESGDYGPLVIEMPRADGSVLPLPYGWCQGYVAGLALFGEAAQAALLADETAAALLSPVFAFLMYEEAQLLDPPNEAAHRETVGELGGAAAGLYRWWQAR